MDLRCVDFRMYINHFKLYPVSLHIQTVMSSCAQTLYALRVLRAHGLHDTALHNIYRSVVLAKLYASSSWIGFSNATDRQKLQAFLNRSKRSGFCDNLNMFYTLSSRLLVPPNTIFVTDHTTGYFVNVLPDWLIVILSLECYIVICIDWL